MYPLCLTPTRIVDSRCAQPITNNPPPLLGHAINAFPPTPSPFPNSVKYSWTDRRLPQVLNREGSSFESDVYSFGVVVWECLTRKIPWKDVVGVDMLLLAVTGGERPAIPADAPADLASLAKACWAQDPRARPAFKEILAELNAHYRRVPSQDAEPESFAAAAVNNHGRA